MKKFRDINSGKIVEADERWAKVYKRRKDMVLVSDDTVDASGNGDAEDGDLTTDEDIDFSEVNTPETPTTKGKRKK